MSEPATTQIPPVPCLSPKDVFLALQQAPESWRSAVRNDITQKAITFAFAEYAASNPPADRLKGAIDFIETLFNLAEPKSQPRPQFPDRRLTSPETLPSTPEKKK